MKAEYLVRPPPSHVKALALSQKPDLLRRPLSLALR